MLEQAIHRVWIHFPTSYTREEINKHLDSTGIEPQPAVLQASALFITPWPLWQLLTTNVNEFRELLSELAFAFFPESTVAGATAEYVNRQIEKHLPFV